MASKNISILKGGASEDRPLDKKEIKLVVLFTREGSNTYLDRYKSYIAAGYGGKKPTVPMVAMNANTKFRQPHIAAAIRKMLPQVAFDQLFVRTEMKELYMKLKADDKTREQADMLKEMAKVCGLYNQEVAKVQEKAEEPSEHIAAFQKQANELWQKRIASKSENISEKIS